MKVSVEPVPTPVVALCAIAPVVLSDGGVWIEKVVIAPLVTVSTLMTAPLA